MLHNSRPVVAALLLGCASFVLLACDDSSRPAPPPADAAGDAGSPAPLDASASLDAGVGDDSDAGSVTGTDASGSSDAHLEDTHDATPAVTDAGMEPAPVVACKTVAPTACPSPAPRYPDVAPIFKQRCSGCHSADWSGPWPLDTYGHIADWQDTVRDNLLDCTMPPPEAGIPMPLDESQLILTWIRCGLPK